MDGRYTKVETQGEIPNMGPFQGFGIYGFNNVTRQFVASWVDNCGTGIMHATGDLSSDRKVLTMTYTYNCPIRKGPAKMREVQTHKDDNHSTLEMFATDPRTGKEFRMMELSMHRQPGNGAASVPTGAK